MSSLMECASKYAALGWKVFPLCPGQKIPITQHGVKDATVDQKQISQWWYYWPKANIGLACGDGIYVVDVDVSGNGVDGRESLDRFPPLPPTVRQDTPRGGFHAFYTSDTPVPNKNSWQPGIDLRGQGYYVVLPPSIHPNGQPYRWTPGRGPWDIAMATYPDFMRPDPPPAASPIAPPALPPTAPQPNGDILGRASAYLAECAPAIQGQGGHNKLFWAASALIWRFNLSDHQAYELLACEYNPRCSPPWNLRDPKDCKDFSRKITEARTKPPAKANEWRLEENPEATCDLSGILARARSLSKGKVVEQNDTPPLARPPGLAGEIYDWILSTSIRVQPDLAIGATLAFLGALFGRKIKDGIGTRTNLYAFGVAPTASGKNAPITKIAELCEAAGCRDLLGGDSVASDAAVEEQLSKCPATLFLWDEISFLLQSFKVQQSHRAGVASLLMRMYSAAGLTSLGRGYADKEKQRTLVQPCCCIYGTTTIESFLESITSQEIGAGWIGRWLLFRSDSCPAKNRSASPAPPPQGVIDLVQKWYRRQFTESGESFFSDYVAQNALTGAIERKPPSQFVVETASDAEELFKSFDDTCEKHATEYPGLAGLWRRGEELARKVALILAASVSFDSPRITMRIAGYSVRLVRILITRFCDETTPEISETPAAKQKQSLQAIISEAGIRGITRSGITRKTQSLRRVDRDQYLQDLIEGGNIAVERVGRALRYWAENHYAKRIRDSANYPAAAQEGAVT